MLDKVALDSPPIAPADRSGGRLRSSVPYLKALAVYLCSRLVVFLGVVFGRTYIALGNDTWLGGTQWYHRLLRWDSEWYKIIATEGYKYDGDPDLTQTVVFYPLYPTLSRLVSEISGIEVFDSMLLVANLATGAAVLMFSFFLAVPRQRFFAAAMLAGLAVAARSSGIVLFPVLLWELWRCRSPKQFLIEAIPLSIVATSGLWLYVMYLGVAFGHPMAFSDGQAAFHENTTMPARLASALMLEPFRKINLTDISPAGLDQWFTLIFIALIVRCWFTPVSRA